MKHTLRIRQNGGKTEYEVESGTNLLKFLRSNSYSIGSFCGGNGTCGKCRVKVSGQLNVPTEKENSLLGNELIMKGFRLTAT